MLQEIKDAKNQKYWLNRILVTIVLLIEGGIAASIVYIFVKYMGKQDGIRDIYYAVGLGIILLWIGVVIGYLVWAVYFYNINLGLTNHDWAEIRAQKQESPGGQSDNGPTENPHAQETLGLPPGTVRGILAISLLIGGLALFIASLGMPGELENNQLLVDNFEFFKTAFLMMIAFYFGDKALKHLNYQGGKTTGGGNGPSGDQNTTPADAAGSVNNTGPMGPDPVNPNLNSADPVPPGQQQVLDPNGNVSATGTANSANTAKDFEDPNAVG